MIKDHRQQSKKDELLNSDILENKNSSKAKIDEAKPEKIGDFSSTKCPKCSKGIPYDSVFCVYCGYRI